MKKTARDILPLLLAGLASFLLFTYNPREVALAVSLSLFSWAALLVVIPVFEPCLCLPFFPFAVFLGYLCVKKFMTKIVVPCRPVPLFFFLALHVLGGMLVLCKLDVLFDDLRGFGYFSCQIFATLIILTPRFFQIPARRNNEIFRKQKRGHK